MSIISTYEAEYHSASHKPTAKAISAMILNARIYQQEISGIFDQLCNAVTFRRGTEIRNLLAKYMSTRLLAAESGVETSAHHLSASEKIGLNIDLQRVSFPDLEQLLFVFPEAVFHLNHDSVCQDENLAMLICSAAIKNMSSNTDACRVFPVLSDTLGAQYNTELSMGVFNSFCSEVVAQPLDSNAMALLIESLSAGFSDKVNNPFRGQHLSFDDHSMISGLFAKLIDYSITGNQQLKISPSTVFDLLRSEFREIGGRLFHAATFDSLSTQILRHFREAEELEYSDNKYRQLLQQPRGRSKLDYAYIVTIVHFMVETGRNVDFHELFHYHRMTADLVECLLEGSHGNGLAHAIQDKSIKPAAEIMADFTRAIMDNIHTVTDKQRGRILQLLRESPDWDQIKGVVAKDRKVFREMLGAELQL